MSDALIDVNVSLSRWPTRRMPLDETDELVAKLAERHVMEAWAGSLDGILHKDLAAVNVRLSQECRQPRAMRLVPFGTVNPKLPDWEEDMRRCVEDLRMPGIRIYPNYHGYTLDDPAFARLLELSVAWQTIVSLPLVMEDERMMHPLLRVPPVDIAPLAETLQRVPEARIVLLNAPAIRGLRGDKLQRLLSAANVSVDIAMLDGLGGVAKLLEEFPVERVLFGSHAPLFYVESSLLKLHESTLETAQWNAMAHGNARRLLPEL